MITLEDQLRHILRGGETPEHDELAERILDRVETQRRRRRVTSVTAVAVAVVAASAVGVRLAASAGDDLVSSVPANDGRGQSSSAPTFRTPRSVAAYLAAQQVWISCLRERGVRVSGPDENHNVSVNPDPDLESERDSCVHLLPALSNDVERALQADSPPAVAPVLTRLSAPLITSRTGTATVDLGQPPAGANGLEVFLTCLTEGTFELVDGANLKCPSPAAVGESGGFILPVQPGTTSTTIRTDDSARWRLTWTWALLARTP